MTDPITGGRYVRDPETGALERVLEAATQAPAAPTPPQGKTAEAKSVMAETTPLRKGK